MYSRIAESPSRPDARPSRNRLFWICQIFGWSGVVFVAMSIAGPAYMAVSEAAMVACFRVVFGITLTCGLRLVYRQLRTVNAPLKIIIPAALMLSLAVALTDVFLTRRFAAAIGLDLDSELLTAFMRSGLAMRWILYSVWSLLYFGINYLLDAQQIELELARAESLATASEFKALKAQTNPHFLFNALGSIVAEAGDNPKLRTMILALSDYLRYSLQIHNDKEPLGHELDALESYLQVEKARFDDKLDYRIFADERARSVIVPISLVQPLLENAIKYGQQTSDWPLVVTIRAEVEADYLELRVSNSGTWIPPEDSQSTKTGLSNMRRRLEILYKNAATLEINSDKSHVEVITRIPLESGTVRGHHAPESTDS